LTVKLEGRICLVTGGAQGIGLGIARQMAVAGALVMLADLNADKAANAARELSANGYEVSAIGADVGVQADVSAAVQATLDAFGAIDILVCNAGGSGHVALPIIEEIDEVAWDGVINSNLRGTYLFTRAVAPLMKARRYGRIITFSSVVARGFGGSVGTVGARLPYCAAKAGIEAFTRQLAHDVRGFGITANCVAPGMVMTEPGARMYERFALLDDQQQEQVRRAFADDFCTPDDVGELVTFLASASARHISGQTIPIGVVG
jgi:NAD(P)-dependent dehydrogenase (short-subunit alcohol dehydrogenase family)